MKSLLKTLAPSSRGVVCFVGAGGKTSLMFALAREIEKNGGRVLTTTTTKILRPGSEQSSSVIVAGTAAEAMKNFRRLESVRHITAVRAEGQSGTGKLLGYDPVVLEEIHRTGIFDWILVEADGSRNKSLKAPALHEPVLPAMSDILIGVLGLDAIGKPLTDEFVFRPELVSKVTGLKAGEVIDEETIAALYCSEEGIFGQGAPFAKRYAFLNKADLPGAMVAGKRICHILLTQGAAVDGVMVGSARATPPVSYSCAGRSL